MNDVREICFTPTFNKIAWGGGALAFKKTATGPPLLDYNPPHTKTRFNLEQILFTPLIEKFSQKLSKRFFTLFKTMLASVRNTVYISRIFS
jgi:hypothetical protein